MIKALKMMFFTHQVMQTYARTLCNPDHSNHLATYFEQDHRFFKIMRTSSSVVIGHGTVLTFMFSPCSQKQAVIGFLCRSD